MALFGELARDLLWWRGFSRRARRPAVFVSPCWAARLGWSYDPRFEPHTDGVEWLAMVEDDTRFETWLIGERLWHGWPDPPQWAFWALDATGALICAWDFDHWPRAWERRAETSGCLARSEGGPNREADGERGRRDE